MRKRISDEQKKQQERQDKLAQELIALEMYFADENDEYEFILPTNRRQTAPPESPEISKYNPDGIHDIITFAEHPYFLGQNLHPWQKLILILLYMGIEGNAGLSIDEGDKETQGCNKCVWEYCKKAELESALLYKETGLSTRKALLPVENSPCLKCSRFDKTLKEYRFSALKDSATSLHDERKYERIESETTSDRYQSMSDLLEDSEINTEVIKQIRAKLGNKFNELVLVLGRRSGKALDINTPIITDHGWSTMGNLKIGDKVFAPDGSMTTVIAKSDIDYQEQSYELSFSNGDKIIAGAGHEWITLPKSQVFAAHINGCSDHIVFKKFTTEEIYKSFRFKQSHTPGKKTTTINEREYAEYNHAIAVAKPLKFPAQNLTIHPYLLGVILGGYGKLSNATPVVDEEILEYIGMHCGHNASMCSDGEHLYSVQYKALSNNKQIPDIFLRASEEQRMELLRGLNDMIGYVDPDVHSVEFCTTDKKLSFQYYELVCGLGYNATIHKAGPSLHEKPTSDIWRITYFPHGNKRLFNLAKKQSILNSRKSLRSDVGHVFITGCRPIKNPGVQCIQVDHPSHSYLAGKTMIPTHNSFLVSIIGLYEVYRLLSMKHPQKRYNLLEFDEIQVLNVAVNENQAKTGIFSKMKPMALSSPYFSQHIGKDLELEIRFLTENDKQENERRKPLGISELEGSIILKCGHSNAAGLVGGTNWAVIMDEVAAMSGVTKETGIDYRLYEDLFPTIATFGEDGRFMTLSQPKGEEGLLFDLYSNRKLDPTTLILQLPTWRSNPSIPLDWLAQQKAKEPLSYPMQYGAQFGSNYIDPFLTVDMITQSFAIRPTPRLESRGQPFVSYFCHIDPATSSDDYALVICHAMPSIIHGKPPAIMIDHIHYWEPSGNIKISSAEVEEYVIDLHRKFKFQQVSFDAWNSQSAIHNLQSAGINAVCKIFSKPYQELIYGTLFELFSESRIFFYNINTMYLDKKNNKMLNLMEVDRAKEQLKMLQKKWKSYGFKIEATQGYKDDIPDCIAAAAYECLINKTSKALPKSRTVRMGS